MCAPEDKARVWCLDKNTERNTEGNEKIIEMSLFKVTLGLFYNVREIYLDSVRPYCKG